MEVKMKHIPLIDEFDVKKAWNYVTAGNIIGYFSPLPLLLSILGVFTLYSYLASVITGNCSQVDRLWSISPVVYVATLMMHHLLLKDEDEPINVRLIIMTVLAFLWGARLTFNFWRRGGYDSGGEDYRWPVLRSKMHPAVFHVFNIVFISAYQNFLLLLIVLPSYAVWHLNTPLNKIDYVAIPAFLFFLAFETIADQQQWVFQEEKWRKANAKENLVGDEALGFRTTGLFKYCRHPNYFAEQMLWYSFYLFSVAAGKKWLNYTISGAVLLSLLFMGSLTFSESLTAKKYPMYREYQKTTSSIIPWIPGKQLTVKKEL